MFTPQTYTAALLLTILSMICWGSWANMLKLAGKWRFELFYFDYSIGVLVAAIAAAGIFGTGGEEITFQDNLLIASKTSMAWAVLAGIVFNIANTLLVAAISLSGMAVAFPVGIGLALVVGVVWNYFLNPQGNPLFLALGVLLVTAAIIVDAMAYSAHSNALIKPKSASAAAASANVAPLQRSGVRKPTPAAVAAKTAPKGLLLSLGGGLLMGAFYPLVEMSRAGGEIGLKAYSIAVLFAIGVFCSTFVLNLYFMNLPIDGPPLGVTDYFKGKPVLHLLGLAGGVIWCTGAIANFLASGAPKSVQVGPAISYGIGQGATMVSALWGLLVWREFAGASSRVRFLLGLMLLLFIGGLALLSMAPLFVTARA